jgi:ATP-binding cassette subfamily C protein
MVLAGLADALALASLLPLLGLLTGSNAKLPPPLNHFVDWTLETLGQQPSIEILIAIVLTLTLLRLTVTACVSIFVGRATSVVNASLRTQLIQAFSEARWSYFVEQKTGRLANALGQESARSSQALMMLCDLAAAAAQAAIMTAVAVLISWEATAFVVAVALLNLISLARLMDILRGYNRKQTILNARLMSGLIDSLTNMKSLKAMGAERRAAKLLVRDVAAMRRTDSLRVVLGKVIDTFQELIKLGALIGLLLFMLKVAAKSLEQILVILVLFIRLLQSLAKMQKSYRALVNCEAPFEHVHELLETTRNSQEIHRGVKKILFEGEVRLNDVVFGYGMRDVLKGVSLSIPARSFICLSGPSGSGKTTILDVLSGLLQPQGGDVLVDSVPLGDIDIRSWRRQIGYAPQELVLLHDTIFVNVTLGDGKLTEGDVEEALRTAGAWVFVGKLPDGIHTVVGERGTRLSGGQRQRIALARALVRRPRLLILDEVTSSLDMQTEEAICAELKKMRGKVTILAASHRPSLTRLADEVYQVEEGTLTRVLPDLGSQAHGLRVMNTP